MAEEITQQSGVGLPAGTKIGKYEIVERVKIGGQAVVYKAYDSLLGRDVAIKQISSHLAEDAEFLKRFRKEAQILARLGQQQPAIVTIHELVEDRQGLFIVMEYVSGRNLEAVLEEAGGPIEIKAALQVIWRLAGALHSVHSAGIVHRDIKPANIMIGEGLRVKIADFGVAASITGQTSMLLGTTKYMAPELFSGQTPGDARVDIYSLGFIAYEALVGREKFKEVFADVMRDPHTESLRWMKWHSDLHVQAPAVHEVNPAVPEPLSQIVAKMMAKDPNERYESMEALGRDIKASFSPRMRAESGAGAPAPVAAPPVAMPVGDETQAPSDEALAGGPDTAALPKRVIPLKTKLIVAGAVFVAILSVIIGIAIYQSMKAKAYRTSAKGLYQRAWEAYDVEGDYKTAQAAFEKLAADFPETDEAHKASVVIQLCKAHRAMNAYDWQTAQEHEKTAKDRLRSVQARASSGSELYKWTQDFTDYIERFREQRRAAWDFRDRLARASDLLAAGKHQQASDELRKFRRPGTLLPEALRNELEVFVAKLELARFRSECSSEIARGDGLVTEGQLEKAKLAYQNAKSMLEDKAARVLPRQERTALLSSLAAKLKAVEVRGRFEDAMKAANDARTDGDKVGEMAALQRANRIKPSVEIANRIKSLRSQIDLARARDLIDKGSKSKAMEVLRKILEYDPKNDDARALLKSLEQRAKWRTALNEAHSLYRRHKYEQALVKYNEAADIQSDPDIKEKIVDCRYRIQFAVAEKLAREGKLQEALSAYDDALLIRPDKGDLISARQEALLRQLEYRKHLAAGDVAQKNKNWKGALDEYEKARRIMDSAEVKARIASTKYNRFLEWGKKALKDGDPVTAKAYFNRAKDVMATDEVEKLIAHAESLIKEAEE